jgi:tRNA threonylcarbamoyladenosine biosynthesis protein TsaB
MARILCLETATTNCSVAIAVDGVITFMKEDNNQSYSHAELLHVFIEEVLSEAGVLLNELDAIAISKGPGSYTGLRIGVSAAKGLCFTLDIPLISISTVGSLAHQVSSAPNYIIPMIDARRMEVYSAVFNGQHEQVRETKAEIVVGSSFDEYLEKGAVVFIGNGVDKFRTICTHKNAVFFTDNLPSAQEMALMAESKFKEGTFENVAYFEPYYLKDFVKS